MMRGRVLGAMAALLLGGSAVAVRPKGLRVGVAVAADPGRGRAAERLVRRLANATGRRERVVAGDPTALLAALRVGEYDVVLTGAAAPADGLARSTPYDPALGGTADAAYTRGTDAAFTALVDREAKRVATVVR